MLTKQKSRLDAEYAERDSVCAPMDDTELEKFQKILAIHKRRINGDPEVADVKHYLCNMGPDDKGRVVMRHLDQSEFDAWCKAGPPSHRKTSI